MLKSWQALFFVLILLSSIPVMPLTSASISIDKTFLSPKKQIAYGSSLENVVCFEGLELMKKLSDNSPACVKPQTAQKLVERGWGIIINLNSSLVVTTEKTRYTFGEKIPITIKNISNMTLEFPDGNFGIGIWDANKRSVCCIATENITQLKPNMSHTFKWNQDNELRGTQVKAGNYTITVLYGTSNVGIIYSESKTIEIK